MTVLSCNKKVLCCHFFLSERERLLLMLCLEPLGFKAKSELVFRYEATKLWS